jgi:hypothetical protein
MGTVLNLRIYRCGKTRSGARDDAERMWGCNVCGGSTWILTTSSEVRCAACGSAAGNLAAVQTGDSAIRPGPSESSGGMERCRA